MGKLSTLIRKTGRTAQVHIPHLQNAGKALEAVLRRMRKKLHDPDLEGLKHISVPRAALFLDIGANRGSAAWSFWTISPDCRVVCFEPNAFIVDRFLAPLQRRGVAIHVVALGERPGQFPLHVPVYNGVVFDGLASLEKSEAEGWLDSRSIYGFDARKLEIRQQICEVKYLDSFEYNPFFIKIDVQGREGEVIKGGIKTIARSLPIIFAESESLEIETVMATLRNLGYRYYRYDGTNFCRDEMSATNIYLIPDAKLAAVDPGHLKT